MRLTLSLKLLWIFLGSLLLCALAFYNKFPILYPDTAVYISSGCEGYVPIDRPITYGLFVRHVSMLESLWLVIWLQSLILSYVIFLFLTRLFHLKAMWHLPVISILIITSAVSLPSGQLIPDIFTPIFVLGLALIISGKLNRTENIIVYLITFISVTMHYSHVPLGLVLIACLWLMVWKRLFKPRLALRMTALFCLSIFVTMGVHKMYGGSFNLVEKGYLFRFSRLVEIGLVDEYLKSSCVEENLKLCDYEGRIPTNYLWDSESPLMALGGWDKNEKEYKLINRNIILSPKYWPTLILSSLFGGAQQFWNIEVFDARPVSGSFCYEEIERHFKKQIRSADLAYQSSHFERLEHKMNALSLVSFPMMILSFIFLLTHLYLFPKSSLNWLILFIMTALVFNACITGALSTVVPRYQNRISWLPQLLVLSIFIRMISPSIEEKFERLKESLKGIG